MHGHACHVTYMPTAVTSSLVTTSSGRHRGAAHETSMGSEFTAGMAELLMRPAGIHLTKSAGDAGKLHAQAFTTEDSQGRLKPVHAALAAT